MFVSLKMRVGFSIFDSVSLSLKFFFFLKKSYIFAQQNEWTHGHDSFYLKSR